ncbi:hypothetical protein AGMMS49574_29890 [Bacteroidia bacterium]|nr:hypothetical protein AGMMS49574_29890 [Bacteroidia bacterium]
MGYSKLKIPKVCEHCGKQFEAKTVITRFCSKECGHKADNARKKAGRKDAKQQELIAKIPNNRPYISISEAVLLFGISRDTIYRLVENPTQTDPLSLIQTDPPLRFKLTHPADSN